jgi:hypothetical protein
MTIDSYDILDSIFDHIHERKSIDHIKSQLMKYDEEVKQKQNEINEKYRYYLENFESLRNIQNNEYEVFLKEKQELIKNYEKKPSQEALYKILGKQFTYKPIEDIFTFDITRNKKLDTGVISKPKENPQQVQLPKEMPSNIDVVKQDKFWQLDDKEHKDDTKFWKKQKDAFVRTFFGQVVAFDNDDADAILDGQLSSITLNLFLEKLIKDEELTNKFVLLNAELYYDFSIMREKEEDLDDLLQGYLKNIDIDWNNKKVIIPINVDNSHWISGIIDPFKQVIYILDPYGNEYQDVAENIHFLVDWLVDKRPNLAKIEYNYVFTAENPILQEVDDVENCGVFTIMYFIYYIKYGKFPTEKDFTYDDIDDARKYIYHIITRVLKCPPGKKLNVKTKRCIKDK